MDIKELISDYVFYSRYSQITTESRNGEMIYKRENWEQAVNRVQNVHREKLKRLGVADRLFNDPEFTKAWEHAFTFYCEKKVLGSQRLLQFGNPRLFEHEPRVYNCAASYLDRIDFFQELTYLLLCGCGCGYSVQSVHTDKLPEVVGVQRKKETFVIPDSIEGWSSAVGLLLHSYYSGGRRPVFDYSAIRPKGALITSGNFKAPGPQSLKTCLVKVDGILRNVRDRKLTNFELHRIACLIADCVISGGVRRSALITVFDPEDIEMRECKTGDWYSMYPELTRCNNSMMITPNTAKKQFMELKPLIREYGEPGIVLQQSENYIVNPCFHRDTRIATRNGLIKIGDLYAGGRELELVTDNRIGKGDEIDTQASGVTIRKATEARLIQEQAQIFKLTTTHGHVLRVTAEHEFPTPRGRKKLKELLAGDLLYLQPAEGSFGSEGTFNHGFLLGLTEIIRPTTEDAVIGLWDKSEDDRQKISEILVQELDESNTWIGYSQRAVISSVRLFGLLTKHLGTDEATSTRDRIPEVVWRSSREFQKGYLQGLFFSEYPGGFSSYSASLDLVLACTRLSLVQDLQILLQNFGICSEIQALKDGTFRYRLILNRTNALKYKDVIGAYGHQSEEYNHLCAQTLRERTESYVTKVQTIEEDCIDDVFCFTQPETNSTIANGVVTGQCAEVSFYPQIDEQSGWGFCNLVEINGVKSQNEEMFLEQCKAATFLATLQALYTDFHAPLSETTIKIARRDSLLGVSITGMADNPKLLFNEGIQNKGANLVKEVNRLLVDKINLPILTYAARTTTIKPSGNSAQLLGTASGIHSYHFPRYIRYIQASAVEDSLKEVERVFPEAIQEAFAHTKAIAFPVDLPEGVLLQEDSCIPFLKRIALTKANWIASGKNELNAEWNTRRELQQNVSCTVQVNSDEWDECFDYVWHHRDSFGGISFLPKTGDLEYRQAPYTSVLYEVELVEKYGRGIIFSSGLITDSQSVFRDVYEACDAALGRDKRLLTLTDDIISTFIVSNIKNGQFLVNINGLMVSDVNAIIKHLKRQVELRNDWVRRFKKFANNYFKGDLLETSHALKHVNNLHYWQHLQAWPQVKFEDMVISDDFIKDAPVEVACAGGSCEL